MTFPEKLQTLRKSRGWSQEQLASQLSVSRQALSKWELGTAVPDTANIVELSRLFQVSTDYLLLDEYDVPAPLPAAPSERKFPALAVTGGCMAGLGAVGLLVLSILAHVYPSFELISYANALEEFQLYLSCFLQRYQLDWLFWLCCALTAAGLFFLWLGYPKNDS